MQLFVSEGGLTLRCLFLINVLGKMSGSYFSLNRHLDREAVFLCHHCEADVALVCSRNNEIKGVVTWFWII